MSPHVSDAIAKWLLAAFVILVFAFLYMPIVHILFASLSSRPNFPYPPEFNFASYVRLSNNTVYQSAFLNSLLLASCTAVLSPLVPPFSSAAIIALMHILPGSTHMLRILP